MLMTPTPTPNSSQSIAELTKAMIEFHKKCPKIPKSSKNPFLKSKYADLSTILDIVQPVLCECGLNIQQHPSEDFGLVTILSHISGEYIASSYNMQPLESIIDKESKAKAITPQSIGSVITYQRRYAIGAVLNLNIDDDTDAQPTDDQVSSGPATPPPVKKTAKQLMEEAAAAKSATTQSETAPEATATVAATSTAPTTTNVETSIPNKPNRSMDEKCTEEESKETKALLNQWNQSQPGVDKLFVEKLRASGRQKITDLTVRENLALQAAIVAKTIDAFFEKSLSKPPSQQQGQPSQAA